MLTFRWHTLPCLANLQLYRVAHKICPDWQNRGTWPTNSGYVRFGSRLKRKKNVLEFSKISYRSGTVMTSFYKLIWFTVRLGLHWFQIGSAPVPNRLSVPLFVIVFLVSSCWIPIQVYRHMVVLVSSFFFFFFWLNWCTIFQGDLGYIYLDLNSRQGKYPGCAHFAIRGGRRVSKTEYQLPVCSLYFVHWLIVVFS